MSDTPMTPSTPVAGGGGRTLRGTALVAVLLALMLTLLLEALVGQGAGCWPAPPRAGAAPQRVATLPQR